MLRIRRLACLLVLGALGSLASLPVLAETRIEETRKLEPGGRFVLDSDAGSVRVTGTSEPGARIVITSKHDDLKAAMDFTVEESPGLVKLTAKRKKGEASSFLGWLFGENGGPSVRFEVTVPAKTGVEVKTGGGKIEVSSLEGESSLETSGGPIEATGLKGDLTASTSGGHVQIEKIEGSAKVGSSGGPIRASAVSGGLIARTSGGSIQVDGVGADVEVETSGGSIRVSGAGGAVRARTSGGSVDVALLPGNSHGGDISSMGGGIRVALDPAASLVVEATTMGGSVTSELPIQKTSQESRSKLVGTLGAGGETLKVTTMGGSIRLEKL